MSALCDGCSRPAEYTLTAAYDLDLSATHPTVACYPAPMIRACRAHLSQLLDVERSAPFATPLYLLTPLPAEPVERTKK